jgi:hypothetical protein
MTFYGPLHLEPWVKIHSIVQMRELVGHGKWSHIEVSKYQMSQYAKLFGKGSGEFIAAYFDKIPILIRE